MANTTIPIELSSTPGIVDNSNATAITIDSSENVGIGTSSPSAKLHVQGETTANRTIYIDNAAGQNVSIANAISGGLPSLTMSTAGTERLRIDSSGNVGIGTTSPDYTLEIYSGTASSDVAHFAGGSGTSRGFVLGTTIIDGRNDAGVVYNANDSSGTHIFQINGTGEAARIDSSGNVGIGTSSPVSPLHIQGDDNVAVRIKATGANSLSRLLLQNDGRTWAIDNDGANADALTFYDATAVAERMRIDSSGNVGIGTTSPTQKLDISGGHLRLDDAQRIRFGGGTAAIEGSGSANILSLITNNTERMRIDSSGRVGIGQTSPGAFLDMRVDATSTSDYMIKLLNARYSSANTSGENKLGFGWSNHQAANIAAYKTTANTTGFKFYCESGYNTEVLRMTLDSAGNLNIAGVLSKGSGSFKIDHPLEAKKDTHHLVHSFIEGPQADNIYRGKVDLVAGSATVNIDTVAGMTEGTFVALNTDVQCFTTNESNWDAVKGSVSGNILTIESQNSESTATISWLVIGERQDQHMLDTDWTDENGKVIVEPLKTNEK